MRKCGDTQGHRLFANCQNIRYNSIGIYQYTKPFIAPYAISMLLFPFFRSIFFLLSVGCIFLLVLPLILYAYFYPKKNFSFNLQSRINYNTSVKSRFTNRMEIQMSQSVASNMIGTAKHSDRQQTSIHTAQKRKKKSKTRTRANGKQYKILIIWKWNWNLCTQAFAFPK